MTLDSLDADESLDTPSVASSVAAVVPVERSIHMYGTHYTLTAEQVKRLQQNCAYFHRLWGGGWQESRDAKTEIELPHVLWKPETHWVSSELQMMVQYFGWSARELYRESHDTESWTYEHWLAFGYIARYFDAPEHLVYAQRKLLRYIDQRRSVRGQIWNDLLPLFTCAVESIESQRHLLLQALCVVEEPQFIGRWYHAYEQCVSPYLAWYPSVFDELLLVNPFEGSSRLPAYSTGTMETNWWSAEGVTLLHSPHCPPTMRWVEPKEFDRRLRFHTLEYFHKVYPIDGTLPVCCIAGGFLSMILHEDESLFASEMVHSDVDIWCLGSGDVTLLVNSFKEYLKDEYNWADKPENYTVHERPGIVTLQLFRAGYQRKLQFISSACSNAANLILSFDFSHLQWYCEPVRYNDLKSEVDWHIRGTKQALLSLCTRYSTTRLTAVKQSRVAKALRRGFHVVLPIEVLVTRDYGTTQRDDPEQAPVLANDYLACLDQQRSRLSYRNGLTKPTVIPVGLVNVPAPASTNDDDNDDEEDVDMSESDLDEAVEGVGVTNTTAAAPVGNQTDGDEAEEEGEDSEDEQDEVEEEEDSLGELEEEEGAESTPPERLVEDQLDEEERVFLEFHSEMIQLNQPGKPFEVDDGTFVSEYENFLPARIFHHHQHAVYSKIPNFSCRSSQVPLLDFRALPLAWCQQWGPYGRYVGARSRFNDYFWPLAHKFRIELPPLRAHYVKSQYENLSDYLMYLKAAQPHDWNDVPILRAVLKFLAQMHEVAATRPPVPEHDSTPPRPTNLNFFVHADHGPQLRIALLDSTPYQTHAGQRCRISDILEAQSKLQMKLQRCERKVKRQKCVDTRESALQLIGIQSLAHYLPPNDHWVRSVIEFEGISSQYWKYRVLYLTEVGHGV